jgi:uncharacterized membrane protein
VKLFWMGAILAALAVSPAAAHKGHAAPSPSPSAEAPGEATPGPAAPEGADSAEAAPPEDSPMDVSGDLSDKGAMAAIPWRTAFTGHLHNKIVHFPLALGLAAAVILTIAPRWPAYEPAARLLLIAGALAAVVAFFSGRAQEEPFEDSPFHSVVELHETFGIASALTLWAGVALTFWTRARRFMPLYGIVLLLLLACTGFLGGVLSHSD